MYNLIEFIQVCLKKDLSLSSVVELVGYCSVKGLPLPKKYVCYNSIKEIILCMAQVYTNIFVQKINNSPYFSISIDGATDISRCKSVCIIVCYIDNLKVKWDYLGSLFLQRYDAQSITDGLIDLFNGLGIDWKAKLVGYCSDGEATVRSKSNGVYGMLRSKAKTLIGIHCLAHSFALIHKTDLTEKYPILNELFQLAFQTYKYINNSSRRLNELFEKQDEIEDIINHLNLLRPIKVRWLSLFISIARIARILKPSFKL